MSSQAQDDGGGTAARAGALPYVLGALGSAVVLLAITAALVLGTSSLGRSPLPYQVLFDYQTAKLNGPPADTIFIGDSTLGNAIDAELWSTLRGKRSVSLALTGVYGYEGGYNFIERSLRNLRPNNVVIMFSPDMMTRPLYEEAFEATRDPAAVPIWQRANRKLRDVLNFSELGDAAVWSLYELLVAGGWRPDVSEVIEIENDYMQQGPRRPPPTDTLTLKQINPDKIKYHFLIGKLCEREGLNCLYLHGPLASPKCESSRPYFDFVATLMAPSNIRQIGVMPLCMPPQAVGDSEDHVLPAFKPAATKAYYEMVRRYLRD
jgi:hypothetical protein